MYSPMKYSLNQVNLTEISSKLLILTENTDYSLSQVNGQRIFRKNVDAWHGPEPSRNCEVFVGRIPHDCFEDVLVPLLMRAGELFELRLMINFSGWNRGYAFAMYATPADAKNAVEMLNNYMIRPSWLLGVCPSVNNCRLYISRIAPHLASEEIVLLFYKLTDEVKDVRIRRNPLSCSVIVEYKSHRGAAIARKYLLNISIPELGTRPNIDWSQPESPRQLLKYTEVGTWSPEGGVELKHVVDNALVTPNGYAANGTSSYALNAFFQARRLRCLQEAQQRSNLQLSTTALARPINLPQILSKLSYNTTLPSNYVSSPNTLSNAYAHGGFYSSLDSVGSRNNVVSINNSMDMMRCLPSPVPGSTPTPPDHDAALPHSQATLYNTNGLDAVCDEKKKWETGSSGYSSPNPLDWNVLGLAELSVWAPPAQNVRALPDVQNFEARVNQYNPWTARLPLNLGCVGPITKNQ